jgi:uncharacterized tellurite resistance protein B-like protein
MIGRMRALLRQIATPGHAPLAADRLPLAMAGLLVEAARADHHVSEAEVDALGRLLATRLEIAPAEAEALVQRARDSVERSVSMFEFTRPLQESLTYEERIEFVRMLWDVVLADRALDKYEEYLVSKVSELLYVARGDVIRTRIEAEQAAAAAAGRA